MNVMVRVIVSYFGSRGTSSVPLDAYLREQARAAREGEPECPGCTLCCHREPQEETT